MWVAAEIKLIELIGLEPEVVKPQINTKIKQITRPGRRRKINSLGTEFKPNYRTIVKNAIEKHTGTVEVVVVLVVNKVHTSMIYPEPAVGSDLDEQLQHESSSGHTEPSIGIDKVRSWSVDDYHLLSRFCDSIADAKVDQFASLLRAFLISGKLPSECAVLKIVSAFSA